MTAPEHTPRRVNRLLEFLPAIYRDPGEEAPFLGRFLLAFESLITGLEQELDSLHRYFQPAAYGLEPGIEPAPEAFLEYLSGWVALILREDWQPHEKRRILDNVVSAYRKRGTAAGLRQMVAAYTGLEVEIFDSFAPFRVGMSRLGIDTMIAGGPPHYFVVRVALLPQDAAALTRKREIVRAIIDQEKPAHTFYDLEVRLLGTMEVGTSQLGINTYLGDLPREALNGPGKEPKNG